MPLARRRLGWFSFFAMMAALLFFLYAGLSPWALHIGGRSTPDELWDGYGEVQASNGGHYVLFVHLQGGYLAGSGPSRRGGGGGHGKADNLHGSAELCTASGVTHTFKLSGIVDSWWATDGAPTAIGLTGGSPVKLQSGWVVVLRGVWQGPALELADPDSSFTEAFTPRGEIRRVTSTADAGTARVTLRYGSHQEFGALCRAIESSGPAEVGASRDAVTTPRQFANSLGFFSHVSALMLAVFLPYLSGYSNAREAQCGNDGTRY